MYVFSALRASRPLGRAAICSIVAIVAAGCGGALPSDSACRNLVYKEGGLSREEYLPCAAEIMAALDVVDPKTRAALDGDSDARSEGEAALREVRALMNAAGGRNLIERWNDRALMDINLSIHNAVTHYDAFYLLRVLDEPHPYAATTRRAAEAEYLGATRRYQEARQRLHRLL